MDFQLLACSKAPDGWGCRIAIPEGHPVFEGHFPGRPVMPAIAHLALAAQVLAAATGRAAAIVAVPFLRLRRPVVPGEVLEVSIHQPASDGAVPFEIRRGEERVSNGILVVDWRE